MVRTVCSSGERRSCILGEPEESWISRFCRKRDKQGLKWDEQKEEMQTSELTDALTCYILHYKSDKRQNIPHMTRLDDSCFAQQHRQKTESSAVLLAVKYFYIFAAAETTTHTWLSGLACRRRRRVSPPRFVLSKELCSAIVLAAMLR